ncbi:rOK family protein [Mycobacterium kansasii]|uniref:ROK family protein n=1 Tax=Mycobacterium kansasii TaxID=1768 RepID=A0A1V3WPF6_MYCKA|nr:rOK family protein [Mycobacterium kansasii]
MTLGIHIGARTTSIVAADLFGRTLDAVETPTPLSPAGTALGSLADSACRYLRRWHRRRALWAGVAIGGTVDGATGHVDHPRLGWQRAPVGPVLADALAFPSRWHPTWMPWQVPSCCWGCDGSRRARRPACTSMPARPWGMRW